MVNLFMSANAVVKNKLYIFHMVLQEASSTKPNRAVANRVRLWSVWFVVSASLFKAPVFCVALTFNPPRCAGSLRFHFHLTVRLLSKHCNMPYACVCMCASFFVIYIFLHIFLSFSCLFLSAPPVHNPSVTHVSVIYTDCICFLSNAYPCIYTGNQWFFIVKCALLRLPLMDMWEYLCFLCCVWALWCLWMLMFIYIRHYLEQRDCPLVHLALKSQDKYTL